MRSRAREARACGLRHQVMLLRHRQTRNCASLERAYTVSKRSGSVPSAGLLSSAISAWLRLRARTPRGWRCRRVHGVSACSQARPPLDLHLPCTPHYLSACAQTHTQSG